MCVCRWYGCLVKQLAEEFRKTGAGMLDSRLGPLLLNSNAANDAKRTESTSLRRCGREAFGMLLDAADQYTQRDNSTGAGLEEYAEVQEGATATSRICWERRGCMMGVVVVVKSLRSSLRADHLEILIAPDPGKEDSAV